MPGADAKAPSHVVKAQLTSSDDTVELKITVSDRVGITGYGFAFHGAPVSMNGGRGKFNATRNLKQNLEWVMQGAPGGTMKVVVMRGSEVLKTREKSTITPPFPKGYDAFEIEIA